MAHASLLSAGFQGIDAVPVQVELDIGEGLLPRWSTVGLAESAVRESKDRVISAVHNCNYRFKFRRITLNLAPADLKKSGTAYDLPIALGLLAASEIITPQALSGLLVLGELSLTGQLRPVRGILSVALLAKRLGVKSLILPLENLREAAAVSGLELRGATTLPQVVQYLRGEGRLLGVNDLGPQAATPPSPLPDLAEVKGQEQAKRALVIAACGFHNLLFSGPPGTGKSMLASRLPGLLPPLNSEEALGTSQIYSMLGQLPPSQGLLSERPFRSPHHSISYAGLIGGGRPIRPGEVSLAHNGVLFLDELTEFKRDVLESLRQPLETNEVLISRARESLRFPARFLLIAAMNPCPCGHQGNPQKLCQCDELSLKRYQQKLSGPLLDRIDLKVRVSPLKYEELHGEAPRAQSPEFRGHILEARDRQRHRSGEKGAWLNGQLCGNQLKKFCDLTAGGKKLMAHAMKKWGFSARAHDRTLKVARTIADLAATEKIGEEHLSEALAFRMQ